MVYSSRIRLTCVFRDTTPPPRSSETKLDLKNPLLLHALPFPGVELGQKHGDPFSSLALPTAASHFVKEENNPGFSAIPFVSSSSLAADMSLREIRAVTGGRMPAGSDRELHPPSTFLLQLQSHQLLAWALCLVQLGAPRKAAGSQLHSEAAASLWLVLKPF